MSAEGERSARGATRPWSRSSTVVFAALALALIASLALTVHPWYEASTETNDAAMYVACARSILAGEGYAYLGEPFTIRPPGLSLLIAPVLAVRGTDFLALHGLISLFGVAACLGFFVWLRGRAGELVAATATLVVWLNPGFQTFANRVLSDVPGLAVLFLALLLARRADERPSLRRELALALAIGLGAYLRSVLVLLVPAILACRLLMHWREQRLTGLGELFVKRALVLLVVPLLCGLPWSLRNAAIAPETPVEQNYIHSYATAMWHVDGGDPGSPRRTTGEILGRIPERARDLLGTLGGRMDEKGSAALALGALALLVLVVQLYRRREPAELFALLVTSVLLAYFGFRPRLAFPVWAIALGSGADLALVLLAWPLPRRIATGLVAGALACLALFDLDLAGPRERARRTDLVYRSICEGFARELSPADRCAAPIGWHYSLYLERPVWSLFFAVRRADSMQAAERVIERHDVNRVLLAPRVPSDAAMLPWFLEEYGARVRGGPESAVVAVRP